MVAEAEPSFFADPKRLIQTAIAVVLLLIAIYVLVPRLFDLQDALDKIGEGIHYGSRLGVVFCVGACSPPTSRSSAASSARR